LFTNLFHGDGGLPPLRVFFCLVSLAPAQVCSGALYADFALQQNFANTAFLWAGAQGSTLYFIGLLTNYSSIVRTCLWVLRHESQFTPVVSPWMPISGRIPFGSWKRIWSMSKRMIFLRKSVRCTRQATRCTI